jgi:hypothetical protein
MFKIDDVGGPIAILLTAASLAQTRCFPGQTVELLITEVKNIHQALVAIADASATLPDPTIDGSTRTDEGCCAQSHETVADSDDPFGVRVSSGAADAPVPNGFAVLWDDTMRCETCAKLFRRDALIEE